VIRRRKIDKRVVSVWWQMRGSVSSFAPVLGAAQEREDLDPNVLSREEGCSKRPIYALAPACMLSTSFRMHAQHELDGTRRGNWC
jgi:hypothetical protein